MSVLLIHLSDIHFSEKSADFIGRAKKLADAALSRIMQIEDIHIIVSGDIANWGLKEEFDLGKVFLEKLALSLNERSGIKPRILLAAGNHDCNFTGDQSVREALLQSARLSPTMITPPISKVFAEVLADFFELQRYFEPAANQQDVWRATVDVDGKHPIRYVLFNSSVMSVKKEEPGKLYLPVPPAEDLNFSRRTVYVMHHPYGWFQQDNARELAQHAAVSADLFLMGHEHVLWAQTSKEIYEDASITYLKGHVLHSLSQPMESAFQAIEFDVDKGFFPRAYKWSGECYEPWLEKSVADILPWPTQNGVRKLALSTSAYGEWTSAGANFTHRNKDKITLQDIFVWPAIKDTGPESDASGSGRALLERSAEKLTEVGVVAPIVVVRGGEQYGKTALAKMLALSLSRKGLYPILINASRVSSWRERSLNERVEKIAGFTYGERNRTDYMQLDASQRILIIDDFDLSQVEKGYFDGLRALRQHFGHIFLMLDSYPGLEVALNEFLRDECFVESEIYDILPCDYRRRLEIIERWLLVGSSDISQEMLRITAAKLSKIVDETLGRNLIPSVPVFVLLVLQRAEFTQDLNTVVKSGSHGFLYESLIQQALSAKVRAFDVVGSLTYLTAFARLLEARGADSVTQAEFDAFHVEHCKRYALNASLTQVQSQMVAADILADNGGSVHFRYPFHYYYFVARHLSQVENWFQLEPEIDKLVLAIHTERNANILLFLAHLGRNPKVAEKIISRANGMFANYAEADLFAEIEALEKYDSSKVRSILFEGSRPQQLIEYQRDQSEADEARRELTEAAEARLRDRLEDALAMNAAYKTLQVLGQVLRNHAGEIEREEKERIARTCVGLGLRVLGFVNDTVAKQGDVLISFRAAQVRFEHPNISEMEVAEEMQRYLPFFMANTTVGALLGIANAIGSENLSMTIDSVLLHSDTGRMLRLATQLEHFSDFPKEEILRYESDTLRGAGFLPNAVFRRFLIRRFYLFPVREELKRAVLDRFQIKALPFAALEQHKSSRTRGAD